MKQTKHTPGPWVVTKATHDGEVINIGAIDLQLVHENGPVNWKNARLIAAAPDLLEALESLTEIVNQIGNKGMRSEYLKAKAAIARARGES